MEDETLYSDDLMPNDSSIFEVQPDQERVQEENDEKAMVQSAAPLLEHILGWFEAEISLCDSIDGIDLESAVDLQAQILARKLLKNKLMGAMERLQYLKEEHIS